jgi:hypothetical protein
MPKYEIRINGLPINRSKFIKALRLTGHLGLKQALDLTVHFERFMHSILVAGGCSGRPSQAATRSAPRGCGGSPRRHHRS